MISEEKIFLKFLPKIIRIKDTVEFEEVFFSSNLKFWPF